MRLVHQSHQDIRSSAEDALTYSSSREPIRHDDELEKPVVIKGIQISAVVRLPVLLHPSPPPPWQCRRYQLYRRLPSLQCYGTDCSQQATLYSNPDTPTPWGWRNRTKGLIWGELPSDSIKACLTSFITVIIHSVYRHRCTTQNDRWFSWQLKQKALTKKVVSADLQREAPPVFALDQFCLCFLSLSCFCTG